MSTLERLKELNEKYGNRPTMPPVYAALETWHALPKLLAVVEVVKLLREHGFHPDLQDQLDASLKALNEET